MRNADLDAVDLPVETDPPDSGRPARSDLGHNRPDASVCFKESKGDLQRDALVVGSSLDYAPAL